MLTESEAAVARAVLTHGPLSRRALAARLHLSPPSLTRLTRPLVDAGILIELDDEVDGSVGRPSRPSTSRPPRARSSASSSPATTSTSPPPTSVPRCASARTVA